MLLLPVLFITMATQIVLVPRKLQQCTPSIQDGLTREMEISQRIYGCQLIQKAGVLLKLEAVTVASAQTILHRFYYRKSLKKFDVRLVVTASLLLACKLEEDPRRVKNLIDIVHLLSKAEDAEVAISEENIDELLLDHDSAEFEVARAETFRCERYILRELGFMVSQTLVHPHRYILQYIHALCKGNYIPTNRLSQIAWGYLNDSMRTTLCCEVQPAVIAVGSIFLAACDLNIPLAKETGWYELFDVTWDDVVKVCTRILSLYKREPPKYAKLAETRPVAFPKPEKVGSKAEKVEKTEEAATTGANSAEGGEAAPEKAETESIDVDKEQPKQRQSAEQQKEGSEARQQQQSAVSPSLEPATPPKVTEPPEGAVSPEQGSTPRRRDERGGDRQSSSRRIEESSSRRRYTQGSRDSRGEYRDGPHRSKPTDSYRNGHKEAREHSSPRRIEPRQSPSRYSSSRVSQWERFSYPNRYDSHSAGFRERRRYPAHGSSFSPHRGENDDSRGVVPSGKRPGRHNSPGRMHKKSSSSNSRRI